MSPSCVYFLAGDETFLKEEWLRKTRENYLKKEKAAGVDLNQFYAGETDISEVLETARTKPFLGKRRLIILKDLENISRDPQKTRQLLSYADAPSPDSVLILETGVKDKDMQKNDFFSALSKKSETVIFKKIYGPDLQNFIARRFVLRKKKAGPGVAELLGQLKGNDLKGIDQEVEKLCVYSGSRDIVAKEDVQRLVGKDITGRMDDMFEAIGNNDRQRALSTGLEFDKKDISGAIGLFCWNLRRLQRVKDCLKEGLTVPEIENRLNLRNRYKVEKVITQAKRLKASWLMAAVSELTRFDLRAKTSGLRELDLDWQLLLVRLLASL